jgi:peroxiredoxin
LGSTRQPTDRGGGHDGRQAGLSPVLLGSGDLDAVAAWVGTTPMPLQDKLDRLRAELRRSLEPEQRAALASVLERLQMLQIVEHGLAVGDTLPDFALPDTTGRSVESEELLAKGSLVLAFFRGTWCPYCSLALQALDEARPRIERLGASMVAVSPLQPAELARDAEERGLGLRLLSDADAAYARICGVQYEMSEAHVALYQRFGLDLDAVNAGSGWSLPVPATYVAGSNGVISFAHGHWDWAQRADPAEIVAAVERLAQAAKVIG